MNYDKELTRKIYKKYLAINKEYIRTNGSDKDKFVVKFMNSNPKVLIILDDCLSANTKELNASIEKIFYQGRHVNITMILAT